MPAPFSPGGAQVCVLKQTSGQSIARAVDTRATWDTVLLDPLHMWSSGSNTRITVPEAGWYKVGCAMSWAASDTNRRTFWTPWQNGAVLPGVNFVIPGSNNSGYSGIFGEAPALAAPNDYFEIDCYHDNDAGAQALNNPCLFWVYRMPW